eukprot:3061846-Pleurochrysis_carterae.AAC.1
MVSRETRSVTHFVSGSGCAIAPSQELVRVVIQLGCAGLFGWSARQRVQKGLDGRVVGVDVVTRRGTGCVRLGSRGRGRTVREIGGRIDSLNTQRTSLNIRGDGRIRVELRRCIGFRGGKGGTRFTVLLASSALGARLIPARLALRAIFVPVIALAPAARRPFVAPGFVWFGPRPFWICILLTDWVPSHREGVCGAGVCFKLAAHIPSF